MSRGLVDTSVFIAEEVGRRLDRTSVPANVTVSMITVGELRSGVLAADDIDTRAARLRTLDLALSLDPLVVDEAVASAWALLRTRLELGGRRMGVNDSWIAATALAHGLPIVTQDDDYDVVDELTIIKV